MCWKYRNWQKIRADGTETRITRSVLSPLSIVTAWASLPVSEQQVRDSKDVLGMVFTNKESVDVVIGWLTLLKENYERLIQEG